MARQGTAATKYKIYRAVLVLYRIRLYERFKNSSNNIYNTIISNIGKGWTATS